MRNNKATVELLWLTVLFACFAVSDLPAETLMNGKNNAVAVFTDPNQLRLIEAIRTQDFGGADLLLKGLDVDKPGKGGETLLWWLVNIGDFEGFQYLVAKGAVVVRQINDGPNIVELCAMQEDRRFLEEVLRAGANLNLIGQYSRETPIFSAVLHRRYENVRFMLSNGACCDIADAMATTPALLAADQRAYDVLVLLLKSGANPRLKNRQGYDVFKSLMQKVVKPGEPDYDSYISAVHLARG